MDGFLPSKKAATAHSPIPRATHDAFMRNEHRIEARTETREQIAVPVRLADGATGTTRNLSASGLFFETGRARRVGSLVELSIDLGIGGRPLVLKGRGQVLRVEPLDGSSGLAVRLLESRLEEIA